MEITGRDLAPGVPKIIENHLMKRFREALMETVRQVVEFGG